MLAREMKIITEGASVHVGESFEKYGGKRPSSNWRGVEGTTTPFVFEIARTSASSPPITRERLDSCWIVSDRRFFGENATRKGR